MATYRINTPDGATYDVTAPDDAKQEDVLAYAQAHHSQASGQPSPPVGDASTGDPQAALKETLAGTGWGARNLAGAGSALAKTYYGGKQLLKGGTLSPEDQQSVKDWSTIEQEAPVGAIAGNVGMMVLPGMGMAKAPGIVGAVGRTILNPNTVGKAAAVGAGYMGIQPTAGQGAEGLQERGVEALKGAAFGAAGYGAAKGIGRVLNPQTRPEVKALMDAGVTPTPGQIIGGGVKKAEEAARSIPILGDMITRAQKKGIEQFNRVAINRALNPVGKSIAKDAPVGYAAVDDAYHAISQTYDDLLPKLKISADAQFQSELGSLKTMSQNLNPAQAQQFNNIVKNEIEGKFTSSGIMSGDTMKQIESKLGQLARNYSRDADYDKQLLGDALQEAQSVIRKMVERNNPQYAGKLAKVNEAYANLLRVENAAARQGAKEGVFTPSQLEAATRALDSSMRKRASAHGKALMQDLATAGDTVLSQKLPNSGTIDRALYGLGGLASGVVNPAIPAVLIGGGALYTDPTQRTLAALLTKRPDLMMRAGNRLSDLAPYAGLAAIGAGQ